MTTGRINQVTLVKRTEKEKTEQLRALSLNYFHSFFVTRAAMNFTSKLPGSGSVIGYDSVNPKRCFLRFNTCL